MSGSQDLVRNMIAHSDERLSTPYRNQGTLTDLHEATHDRTEGHPCFKREDKRQETRAISHCRRVTWKVQLFGGYSCNSRVQVKAGP